MNAFQEECTQAIRLVLAPHDLTLDFAVQAALPPAGAGNALFLRGDLVHEGRHYKIYVYSDGAGANVGRNWYVLESQDYATPKALIDTFCGFLRRCLEGRHPVTALQEARADRGAGRPSQG